MERIKKYISIHLCINYYYIQIINMKHPGNHPEISYYYLFMHPPIVCWFMLEFKFTQKHTHHTILLDALRIATRINDNISFYIFTFC